MEQPKTTLTDGSPVTPDHKELQPNGQQKGYVVLSDEERARGFVRPVRNAYIHTGKTPEFSIVPSTGYAILLKPSSDGCGTRTQMGQAIAETYAANPSFYSGTFCCSCGTHRPLEEFRWEGTDEVVGS